MQAYSRLMNAGSLGCTEHVACEIKHLQPKWCNLLSARKNAGAQPGQWAGGTVSHNLCDVVYKCWTESELGGIYFCVQIMWSDRAWRELSSAADRCALDLGLLPLTPSYNNRGRQSRPGRVLHHVPLDMWLWEFPKPEFCFSVFILFYFLAPGTASVGLPLALLQQISNIWFTCNLMEAFTVPWWSCTCVVLS